MALVLNNILTYCLNGAVEELGLVETSSSELSKAIYQGLANAFLLRAASLCQYEDEMTDSIKAPAADRPVHVTRG